MNFLERFRRFKCAMYLKAKHLVKNLKELQNRNKILKAKQFL